MFANPPIRRVASTIAHAKSPLRLPLQHYSTIAGPESGQSLPSSPPPGHLNHGKVEEDRKRRAAKTLAEAVAAKQIRHNWTKEEISAIYHQPLMELAFQSVSHAIGTVVGSLNCRVW